MHRSHAALPTRTRQSPRKKRVTLRGRDLTSIDDLTKDEILHLFRLTADIKRHPKKYKRSLDGKIIALIFEKPSLRTKTTFEVGIKQLGGDSVYLSPAEINLGKRESVYDVAKNLERMVQGIMIRTFGHDICVSMAGYASIPVINGLTDFEHPCQALADFFTLTEHTKDIRSLKLSYIGDGNNVAHSLMLTAGKVGATMYVATPASYMPDVDVTRRSQKLAAENRGKVVLTTDPLEAAHEADLIYTDTWASMGQES
ncbi:MAG: ornithine carbamoyltransferase, partial [Ignavibacteriae bacterium]|nr:ornithine carbamoyltransferase [Ignavibacteriota bacterium]